MTQSVLVTGANGFVGQAVVAALAHSEAWTVRAAVRGDSASHERNVIPVPLVSVGAIDARTDWTVALRGIDAVVHSAARVHVMRDTAADPLTEFRRVNVEGTLRLARQAATAGVRRFVFLSSIKVNGERTEIGRPFMAEDVPSPVDPYGISKFEAEQGLTRIARETGLEVVVIRPVVVYGPGVKGNFRTMIQWLRRGIPLPLGAIHNKRSFVAVDNLVSLILTCLHHPAAADQIFLVSDGEDLSTTELLRRMAKVLNVSALLLPVPSVLLRGGARLVNKSAVIQRLCGSLQVDITHTCNRLSWQPVVSVDIALLKTVTSSRPMRIPNP